MRPGDIIAGRYRLLRVVRSGGVSVVYRGEALEGGRSVAVKVINVSDAKLDLARRIRREVAILSRLDHPHVVKCYASGSLDEDRMYLALEWLEGQDVADYAAQQPFTLRQVLELLVQVADALDVAHAAGVVHRDIKPANIYLMHPERGGWLDARVLDFGVAKIPESRAALTRAGAILGTPSYMAPEQASQAMDVDARADVFSLGVVAYELALGRLPWTSPTDLARLARILSETPVPMHEIGPEIPEPVEDLVTAMLDNDLEARIQSAAVVRDVAASCLDVLSAGELDRTYVQEPSGLAALVRAETRDVPGARRHSTPTRAIPVDPEPVRYRSVVAAGDPAEAPPSPVVEEHDDTQELPQAAVEEALDDGQPVEATELAPRPSPALPSAAEALDAVSQDDLPLASLSPVDPEAGLLSYVDHTPTEMLYGRVAGLERLERRVTQPLAASQPTLTFVIGPAGIGKTRVRTELAKLVRARARPPRVFAGRAEESFRTTPFAFLTRMLFTEARVRSDDPEEARRAKVLQLVPPASVVRRILSAVEASDDLDRTKGPAADPRTAFMSPELMVEMGAGAEEDRAVVAAFLCEALGVPYPEIPPVVAARHDARRLGQQMRRAVDVVMRALAEQAGLVVLVDDAHLLDRQSGEILAGLTDPRHRVPMAVVAFALPTLLDADTRERSPLAADRGRPRETVELGPLEPRASREMARSLASGPVQSEALERLVQRAAGNPLYLEQLVRAVQASGVLGVGPDGELVLLDGETEDPERVPPTVAAAVSARLSFLKPRLQRVLTAAAVFGEVFWAEGVAELMGEPAEAVLEELDRLLVAAFVRRRSVSRYGDQTELEFTHAVVRSVALSRLKRKRRADFEGRAARYLERVGEADRAVLARHVAQSGDAERAGLLYAEAAWRGLQLGDTVGAGILAEEGLRSVEGVEARTPKIRLYGILEQVALAHHDWEGGREVMDQLAELLEAKDAQADLYLRRSRLAGMARRYEEARVEAKEAERSFAALGDDVEVARAQLYFAEASSALGDGRGALRGYLAAQVGLGQVGASPDLARGGRGLARIALSSGDYKSAENRFRSALVASRAVRDYAGIHLANMGLAEVRRSMGDLPGARGFLEEALEVAFERQTRLTVRAAQVSLLLEEERFDDAFAQWGRLREAADEAGFGAVRRRAVLGQGQAFRRRPATSEALRGRTLDLEEVSARLAVALEEAVTADPALMTALELASAMVEALRGASVRARALAEQAQARFYSEGALSGDEPPAVFYTLARVHQETGAPEDEVRAWFARAVAQVDGICGRLDRDERSRYLERPIARAVLEDAERAGVPVSRDARSGRVHAPAGEGAP